MGFAMFLWIVGAPTIGLLLLSLAYNRKAPPASQPPRDKR